MHVRADATIEFSKDQRAELEKLARSRRTAQAVALRAYCSVDGRGHWAGGGKAPEQVLADTGYRSEAVFEQLADGATQVLVSMGREGKQQVNFHADRKPYSARMANKLRSSEGQAAYRKRKWIAEPPNGWIKSILGFRQFSLRGLHRVRAEWKLVCMALNLRRICSLQLP